MVSTLCQLGTRTCKEKGAKSVGVIGEENKRQVTMAILTSSSTWDMLPFQVIFTKTTRISLPPMNADRKLSEDVGWHIYNKF
jgi:hypothetical protein